MHLGCTPPISSLYRYNVCTLWGVKRVYVRNLGWSVPEFTKQMQLSIFKFLKGNRLKLLEPRVYVVPGITQSYSQSLSVKITETTPFRNKLDDFSVPELTNWIQSMLIKYGTLFQSAETGSSTLLSKCLNYWLNLRFCYANNWKTPRSRVQRRGLELCCSNTWMTSPFKRSLFEPQSLILCWNAVPEIRSRSKVPWLD